MAKRATASKILIMLLIPAMGTLTPHAFGHPAKAAVHAVAKKPVAHAASGKVAARASSTHKVSSEKTGKRSTVIAHAEVAGRGGSSRRAGKAVETRAELRAERRAGTGSRTHVVRAREEATPHESARSRRGDRASRTQAQAPVLQRVAHSEAKPEVIAARPVPAAEATVMQAAEPTVKHDRKHHLPADAAPSQPATPSTPGAQDSGKTGQPSAAVANGVSGSAEASASLFSKSGRLIMPPAMKGSHEILVHQNVMADQDKLERVQDDEDLIRMRGSKTLMALPDHVGLQMDDRLPENRRFARPWTVKFLEAVAKAHYDRFHTALQVNSAVRTVEFQRNLMRTNGNAAPAEGETASPHLTGQAVDLAKKGLSMTEIAWLRGYLLPLVQQGKIDVEEEFQQSCFHISVYRKYVPEVAPRREIVSGPVSGSAIATAMR